MTIGPDIKEALEEVGTAFTILRTGSGEYLDITQNTQVTKPFIREFFLEVELAYDTEAQSGDIITLDVPGDKFMLMNLTSDLFENSIIINNGVLYKCNVSGELSRPSGEADWADATYKRDFAWVPIADPCYGLLTTPEHGGGIVEESPIGYIDLDSQELYIPSSIGAQELDRFSPVSGEYYMVREVKKRRYPNVDLILLSEDNR